LATGSKAVCAVRIAHRRSALERQWRNVGSTVNLEAVLFLDELAQYLEVANQCPLVQLSVGTSHFQTDKPVWSNRAPGGNKLSSEWRGAAELVILLL
jgi:hypothetical protein